jgi:hypothetical protein
MLLAGLIVARRIAGELDTEISFLRNLTAAFAAPSWEARRWLPTAAE